MSRNDTSRGEGWRMPNTFIIQSPVPPAQLWEHQVQEMRNVSTTYDHVVIT